MTNEEMIQLTNQIKTAIKALEKKNNKETPDMKEVGDFLVPAVFMLTEAICDIKRMANALEGIDKGLVILFDLRAQEYQHGVRIEL